MWCANLGCSTSKEKKRDNLLPIYIEQLLLYACSVHLAPCTSTKTTSSSRTFTIRMHEDKLQLIKTPDGIRGGCQLESLGGKLASVMAVVEDSDSVTRRALTSERTVVQRLVLRGRLGRNDGEVSTSKGVDERTTSSCESGGAPERARSSFSPLWGCHLLL
jgi:hypothetical protein